MDSEEAIVQDENLRLGELLFRARRGDAAAAAELKSGLIERKAVHFLRTASVALVGFPCARCPSRGKRGASGSLT
jgi:hypothetical protein